ncbi:phage tail tape measure protein [Marinobacter sp. Arc7-DN-1]|uniref:phage tail tape measure protein n=1 Tax=Marinobacter sp. Arc7-DN-1 TaxID=2304594 RepID=UPI000E4533E1|nr:phage tail tape measure protein [Marinobacter sp. Arc7-DN-1]AXS83256.1 phage tail tape measure protein [Marinobacter sp. Arc7-DN-1]
MADLSKTVEIIFGGTDKTAGAITSVGRNLDALSNRVGNITGPLAGVTDSILKLDAALAALGVAALAFATKEAITFEAALIDLQKVMGEGEGNAKDYADQFSQLSSRFGVDAGAIIQSTADFRQAGYDIEESLSLVEQSLLAVNAADLTTKQSSELLIGTLAGFQAPASEAANLLDVLNGVSNQAGASVEQLGEGFKILSPIAKTLGLSFEETAALLTPVVEVTRSGSESANALKTAISNLIKPTKERKELLEQELGIQLEVNGQRRDTKDVLYDLIDATQGLDNTEKQRVATVIAGAEQMSRFLAVLNGAERSEEILKVALNAGGSALAEFQTKTESAQFALKQLRAAFTTAAATAGLEYIDQTKAVTEATTNLVDSFRQAAQGENADVLFDALRGGLESFAEQVNIIAENLPEAFEGLDFSQLLTAFDGLSDELGDAFEAVFGTVDLSTVEGLESALQKVVDAFTALVNISSGIVSGLEPLFSAIGTGIQEFQDLDAATQQSVGELLGIAKAIDTVLPALSALGGGLESVGNGMVALAGVQGFKAILGNLGSIQGIASSAGKGGLIGLALAGGYGVGKLINAYVIEPMEKAFGTSIGSWLYEQFNAEEIEKIKKELAPLTESEKKLAKETGELKQLNDRLADALDNTKQAAELDTEALNKRAAELVRNANQQDKFNNSLEEFTGSQRKATNAVDDLNNRVERSGGALGEVGDTTRKLAEDNKSLVLGYDEATGKVNSWTGGVIRSNKSLDDAAEKTRKVINETADYRLELEKIDSNERIKRIEAVVSLDIAEVEANADKVVALAQSIGKAFTDSTGLIEKLFGGYDDASRSTQIDLSKQIRKENELREKAFELQEKMTKAEIDYIKEKTRQLSKGDAIIKVDGDGLAPHLEAFMFEILERIQARVNAEGEEMLLGLR